MKTYDDDLDYTVLVDNAFLAFLARIMPCWLHRIVSNRIKWFWAAVWIKSEQKHVWFWVDREWYYSGRDSIEQRPTELNAITPTEEAK